MDYVRFKYDPVLQKFSGYARLPALVCNIVYISCFSFSFRANEVTIISMACIRILGVNCRSLKAFFVQ